MYLCVVDSVGNIVTCTILEEFPTKEHTINLAHLIIYLILLALENKWPNKNRLLLSSLHVMWCPEDLCITLTFTFSHLVDAFIQSHLQGREQSSYEQ